MASVWIGCDKDEWVDSKQAIRGSLWDFVRGEPEWKEKVFEIQRNHSLL